MSALRDAARDVVNTIDDPNAMHGGAICNLDLRALRAALAAPDLDAEVLAAADAWERLFGASVASLTSRRARMVASTRRTAPPEEEGNEWE